MSRPKKYNIDETQVTKLASYGCTNIEIAHFFGCDESLLRKSYSEFLTKGRAESKIRLRQAQFKLALGDEDNAPHPSMLIWLGKNVLGQADAPMHDQEELPEGFDLNVI